MTVTPERTSERNKYKQIFQKTKNTNKFYYITMYNIELKTKVWLATGKREDWTGVKRMQQIRGANFDLKNNTENRPQIDDLIMQEFDRQL